MFFLNDALITLYFWLHGIRHNMVKDFSITRERERAREREREREREPQSLPYLITVSDLLYAPSRIVHTMAFVRPVVEHWLERGITHLVR